MKPELSSVAVAVSLSRVVTSGTWTWVGPFETVSVTVEPIGAIVFPPGSSPRTVSFGSFEARSTRVTLKPFAFSVDSACAYGIPTTGGTAIDAGPFETLIRTFEPRTTRVPGPGDCAITVFTGFSELTSWTSGSRPTFAIAAAASVADCPRTSGTAVLGAPVETKIVTWLPLSIRLPGAGSCRKTMPMSAAPLGWRRTTGLRPAPRICPTA